MFTNNNLTPEQRAAINRANAQHSTGAKSESGRHASSQNRTTHGLARHNGPFSLLEWEDPAAFEALKAGLVAEYQPATTTNVSSTPWPSRFGSPSAHNIWVKPFLAIPHEVLLSNQ